jgi:deazaflavin-dependent oxidoreductase (nitroreductase family)
MPFPRTLAKINRRVTNRIVRYIAPWLPGLGLVIHVGRRSGTVYRTPVNLFTADGHYTIALSYGPNTDWVRNVRAAGRCDVITRGKRVRLVDPRIVHDETRAAIRPLERQFLRLLRVADFLVLDTSGTASRPSSSPRRSACSTPPRYRS